MSVDLWPHRLFWMGDPRAVAIFSGKVPGDERGRRPHIDCGRWPSDWSAREATQILRDLVQRGLLAQSSMYQFSGRGLWAFWLLRDEQDPSTMPFANYENRELWMSLQQRTTDVVATAFPSLKLDWLAGDLTRVT